MTTVAGLVAAGIGVSAMPATVLPLLGFQPLVIKPLAGPVVTRRICMLGRARLPPAAEEFRDAVVGAFALGASATR